MTNKINESDGGFESTPEGQLPVRPVVNDELIHPGRTPKLPDENPSKISVPEDTKEVPVTSKDVGRTQALLETAYQSRGHKLNLKKSDFENLSITRSLWSEDVELIHRLTKTDTLLAFPHKVLVAMAQAEVVGSVREYLLNLMHEAVIKNSAYRSSVIREQFSSNQNMPNRKEINDSLSQIRTSGSDTSDERKYKPLEVDKVAVNFLSYFALDQLLRSEWTIERYIDEMFTCVWASKSRGTFATAVEFGLAKDHAALGLLATHYSERIKHKSQELHTAQLMGKHQASRANEAELKLDSSLGKIHQLEEKVRVTNEEILQLETLLKGERDARAAAQLHHAKDKELMRTRLLRQLKTQTELLGHGSHALGSGSIKTAGEFMDRAREAIDREIEHLKGIGGSGE